MDFPPPHSHLDGAAPHAGSSQAQAVGTNAESTGLTRSDWERHFQATQDQATEVPGTQQLQLYPWEIEDRNETGSSQFSAPTSEWQPRLPPELMTNVAGHVVTSFEDRGQALQIRANMLRMSHSVHHAVDDPSLATDVAALRRNPGIHSRRDAAVQDARNGMPGLQANDENRVTGMFNRDDVAYVAAKTDAQNETIRMAIRNGMPSDQAFEQTFGRHGVEDPTDQRHVRHAYMNAALQAGMAEPQALIESGLTPAEHLAVTLHPRPGGI